MTRVFADTFYYVALLNPIDEAHEQTLQFTAAFTGTMVTTDAVLTELADGLAAARTRPAVVGFVENLHRDKSVKIVPVGRRLLERGWNIYRRRLDKDWSLTDCISFVVMTETRLTQALTADHHFEQAGFRALLK